MQSSSPSINILPTELLIAILNGLDPGGSSSWLYEEPHGCMLGENDPDCMVTGCSGRSSSTWLKPASLVCKRWRAILLPKLFRELVWMPWTDAGRLAHAELELLANFLTINGLGDHVDTITVVFPRSFNHAVTAFGRETGLEASVGVALDALRSRILAEVAPTRLTIVGSFCILAALLGSAEEHSDHDDRFGTPYQVLSLARPKTQTHRTVSATSHSSQQSSSLPKTVSYRRQNSQRDRVVPRPCGDDDRIDLSESISPGTAPLSKLLLFANTSHSPWTSVLLNEGSFIPIYHVYDFFEQRPPSVLSTLLSTIDSSSRACSSSSLLSQHTIAEVCYIAIFPLSLHLKTLVAKLPANVERLYIQLVPSAANQVLKSVKADMRHINKPDLWLERDDAYREIFRSMSGSLLLLPSLESAPSTCRKTPLTSPCAAFWGEATTAHAETAPTVMLDQAELVRIDVGESEDSSISISSSSSRRGSRQTGLKVCYIEDSADRQGYLDLAQSSLLGLKG